MSRCGEEAEPIARGSADDARPFPVLRANQKKANGARPTTCSGAREGGPSRFAAARRRRTAGRPETLHDQSPPSSHARWRRRPWRASVPPTTDSWTGSNSCCHHGCALSTTTLQVVGGWVREGRRPLTSSFDHFISNGGRERDWPQSANRPFPCSGHCRRQESPPSVPWGKRWAGSGREGPSVSAWTLEGEKL